MKIKKVTIELFDVHVSERRIRFRIEDDLGRINHHEEILWESDAVDVLTILFRRALRLFHESYDPSHKGDDRI